MQGGRIRLWIAGLLGATGLCLLGLWGFLQGPSASAQVPGAKPAPPVQTIPAPIQPAPQRVSYGPQATPIPVHAGASVHGPAVNEPYPMPPELAGIELLKQSPQEAAAKSNGCVVCHQTAHDPHGKRTLNIGCTDCHGGNADAGVKEQAHVIARFPEAWPTSANPARTYALLNHEKPEFIRFINPGDLRVAHISCGTIGCHPREVLQNRKSMMTTGCMLWSAALYNNGAVPSKRALFGEAYSMHGVPLALQSVPPPTKEEFEKKGVLFRMDPLMRFEVSQPANILRIFERGGFIDTQIGIPSIEEDPGRPFNTRLSIRGLGTKNRTDPVFIGLAKTRLLDPCLSFLGTNDHPGDYRSSGCSACHMVYANDRSRVHSGPYAVYGNRGFSHNPDPTIPKNEPGHPINHRFAPGNAIPTSQCMTCHPHPGTTVMNSYLGFMWWDEETDADIIYPEHEKKPTAEEFIRSIMNNPNESAARNNLSDPEFLANLSDLNAVAKHTQFADFHQHGWAFRAVFRQDRKGNYLDYKGNIIPHVGNKELQEAMRYQKQAPEDRHPKEGVPVHYMDIHLQLGMHCIDCHFVQDVHGNTKIQQEVRAAVEIQCIDCHGTIEKRATLRTTGPASYTSSPQGGRNLEALRTPSGRPRFEREGDKIFQNSMVEKGIRWEITQTQDTIKPGNPHYNPKAALAKTVRFDDRGQLVWGTVPHEGEKQCAHVNKNMSCIACHSSWNPSCYGCHLPQKANIKYPTLHYEGDVTRNLVSYNFQTLRNEVFMLARDGDATGNRIGPSRSSCAVHVGSYNALREAIYVQQQTISGEGMSGIAFSTNVPHTVRGKDGTKQCTDCHLSTANDNNAIMAQLLMHGTNYLNFMGRFAWTACGEEGINVVEVSERDEPQVVYGSTMQKVAYPERYAKHVEKHHRELQIAHEHPGMDVSDQFFHPNLKNEVLAIQNRGEFMYAACGEGGLRVFDIAFIDHKGFSERFFTAPVSPLGQRFFVKTKFATSVASPTTLAPDPTRKQFPENKEAAVAGIYGLLFVTDKYEGLITVSGGPVLSPDPLTRFLKRDLTFNPDGLLNGAHAVTIVGNYAWVSCDKGLVIIDYSDPKKPCVKKVIGEPILKHPGVVQVQFRYAFVCDAEGLKIFDVTNLIDPKLVSKVPLHHANSVYVARTYAYVAGGPQGLVIIDVENPLHPRIDQVFNAGGCINDLHDVKLGITYVSEFAYLADGKNGLRVVQLTSPETPGNHGFSPRPTPELIATYKIPHGGKSLQVAKALDRDRAVDESGNQIAVFGRIGARPLSLADQQKMYLHGGKPWYVSDNPLDPIYHRLGVMMPVSTPGQWPVSAPVQRSPQAPPQRPMTLPPIPAPQRPSAPRQ
jgi:hypothetical protein